MWDRPILFFFPSMHHGMHGPSFFNPSPVTNSRAIPPFLHRRTMSLLGSSPLLTAEINTRLRALVIPIRLITAILLTKGYAMRQ